MPIKDFLDGARPPASDFNRFPLQQVHIIKSADTSRASTSTNTDDPHLIVNVAANAEYWVTAFIVYAADAARDLKMGFRAPAGATFDWASDAFGSGATGAVGPVSRSYQQLGSTPAPGGIGTLTNLFALPKGILRIGGTAGTFAFQWSQLSAGTPATIVRADSMLILRRLTN